MPLIAFRHVALTTLALLGLACVIALSPVSLQAEDPVLASVASETSAGLASPQYPVSGRILTRTLGDGRIEFCFLPAEGEINCPSSRILDPGSARTNRWILSSELEWDVPFDPDLVQVPEAEQPARIGCELNFERMLAATWKVETNRWRGTGFHIGDGRFVTAHHVVEDVPPYVTLTHGERRVAAGVLGSNSELDVALLEVYESDLVQDVPVTTFRTPTQADVGTPVYLVGYPQAGALTAATGTVTRVWNDEIQTDSSSRGGNSGGPMFDACGDVLGVLWAGSSARNFSHAGDVLQQALADIPTRKPLIVGGVPEWLTPPGAVVWHYAAAPPPGVDCVGVEGEWWIGIAGVRWWEIQDGSVDQTGRCGYGLVTVIGLEQRPREERSPTAEATYTEGPCPGEYGAIDQVVETVLHESSEEFGDTELGELRQFEWCTDQFSHELQVTFDEPLNHTIFSADLIGAGGETILARGVGSRRSWYSNADRFVTGFRQKWRTPPGFEPVAFRVTVNRQSWRVAVQPAAAQGSVEPNDVINLQARIAVRVDSAGNIAACLQLADGTRLCPSGAATYITRRGVRWSQSSSIDWTIPAHPDYLGVVEPVVESCALDIALGDVPWQITALGESGSAVYVGRNQFLTSNRLFNDATPWAVVARRDAAYPAIRVAVDKRDGLALVEILGGGSVANAEVGRFSRATDDAETRAPVLVGFPWGETDRFAMTRLQVSEVTERLIRHDGWGWDRAGAPLVDPCNSEIVGISTGSNEALRAETVVDALSDLRRRARMPVVSTRGPRLHGSVALLPHPVYLGTDQPDFGGWICNVRPSARYDVIYAVYLVSISNSAIAGALNGEREWLSRCGWNDKIFIVEYRSDEAPQAICAQPTRPDSALSSLALEVDSPDGVELVQASKFYRDKCPALPNERGWASTHIVRLRVTGGVDFDDLGIQLQTDDDVLWNEVGTRGDVDPDVRSYTFDVTSGEPTRVVVSLRDDASSDGGPSDPADTDSTDDEAPETECQERHDGRGNPVIAETLHESVGRFGTARLHRWVAPYRCPWRHTHGVEVLLTDPVPVDSGTQLSASLLGVDGRVVVGEWPGRRYRGATHDIDAPTARFTQSWEVPEDFEPVAYEIVIGGRRWVAVIASPP